MEQVLFDELVQSLKEARAIARGEAPASRRIKVAPLDVSKPVAWTAQSSTCGVGQAQPTVRHGMIPT
jgi:hypothetical protein